MANFNDQNDKDKNEVTLGEEKFDTYPKVQNESEKNGSRNKKEVLEADHVLLDKDNGSPAKTKKSRWKIYGILAAVALVLAVFAETIRTAIFRAEDSLLFMPKGGVLIPAVGVILMIMGIFLIIISFISLFNRRGKLTGQQKGIALLIGVLLVGVGVSSFFRYVDFRENIVVDRSMFTVRSYTYLDVTEVNATTNIEGEENQLNYNYIFQNGRNYNVRVNADNMMDVRNIDTKIKSTARRSIDNYAIQEMERLNMYTKDEALELFILE